jgi:RecJ-like exonuclease
MAAEHGERGAVPTVHLRAMIRLLFPEEMTPTSKRQLEAMCAVYDAEAEEARCDYCCGEGTCGLSECPKCKGSGVTLSGAKGVDE